MGVSPWDEDRAWRSLDGTHRRESRVVYKCRLSSARTTGGTKALAEEVDGSARRVGFQDLCWQTRSFVGDFWLSW